MVQSGKETPRNQKISSQGASGQLLTNISQVNKMSTRPRLYYAQNDYRMYLFEPTRKSN